MTAKEFIMALPVKLKEKVGNLEDTLFHFDVDGEHGGQFSLQVQGGEVSLKEGFSGEPTCVVKVKDENLVGIIKGDINPMMAMMTGKLKVSNLTEMMKYADLFKA